MRKHSWSLPRSSCLVLALAATSPAGCGFSESVNASVREQEKLFEIEASKLMLSQAELLVGSVRAHSMLVQPQATARCEQIPMTQCTVCFVASATEQSLDLQTPACSIDPPPESRDLSLEIMLQSLSLAASKTSPTRVELRGQGKLDLSAQIPVFGTLRGTAGYEIRRGIVNTTTWEVDLDLRMTYQTGENTPLEVVVTATGSPQQISGKIQGPRLTCQVSGSLKAPSVACQ